MFLYGIDIIFLIYIFILYYCKIKLHQKINNYLKQFFFQRIIILKIMI